MFKKNDIHSIGNLCRNICLFTSKTFDIKHEKSFDGWCVIEQKHHKASNFRAVLYEKFGFFILCFLGTDKFSIKDHGANLKMGVFGKSRQMVQANKYYKNCVKKYGLNENNIILTGHSEGGTEATFVTVKNLVRAYTFNAYGISDKLLEPDFDYSWLVINYRDEYDPISKFKSNIGTTFLLPSKQNALTALTPIGMMKAHNLENMLNCQFYIFYYI